MEYTIKKLASLAGISTRTLRYYDEIDLLKPLRINSSGYRIYGQKEVDLLQQILFYRELGVELRFIKNIINANDYDEIKSLKEHHQKLISRFKQLSLLINNIETTIKMKEGKINMNDKEKFNGFKKELIEDNEKNYGKEICDKYGDESINKANSNLLNMSKEKYEYIEKLNEQLFSTLKEAMKTNDPASSIAQKAANIHKEWITYMWGKYDKTAHENVAKMYVDDERFTEFYDKHGKGTAKFLRDAILILLNKN